MNQSLEALQAARARARRRALGFVGALIGVCALLLVYVTLSSGAVLKVIPQEAEFDASVTEGVGFISGSRVFALGSQLTLTVAAPGFKTLEQPVNLASARGVLEISLQEIPARISITTKPASPQTRMYLNEALLADGHAYQGELASGDYTLTIENPGMDPISQPLPLQRDTDVNLAIELPLHMTAVRITTEPAGAEIQVNGMVLGVSPVTAQLAPGQHKLNASLARYKPYASKFSTSRETDELALSAKLEPMPGIVHIKAQPADAVVVADGREYPAGTRKVQIPAQRDIQVIVTRPGYTPSLHTVNVDSEQEKTLSVSLRAEKGTLDVRSRPQAQVLLDGKLHGNTPVEIQLLAVAHKLEVRQPGYRSYIATVRPKKGKKKIIDVDLLTERDALIAEAKPAITNSLGMKLRLFKPATVNMGAPRSDPGQQANEVMRTVEITRYFYASDKLVTRSQFARFRPGPASAEPIVDVSWVEAAQFCNWLSIKEGLPPVYRFNGGQYLGINLRANGYRLLSEAEWALVARYGRYQAPPRYSWGETMPIPEAAGNFADVSAKGRVRTYIPRYTDGYPALSPVGSFKPNRNGMYDIGGNAREWVHDIYELLPMTAPGLERDRLGPSRGDSHVIRGSGWRTANVSGLRLTARYQGSKGKDDVGFRVGRWLGE